jgi:hypothetical protein
MSRTVRIAIALLTLGLAALPARAIDPNHLPDDAEVVLHINFRQMLKSDLAKSNKETSFPILAPNATSNGWTSICRATSTASRSPQRAANFPAS